MVKEDAIRHQNSEVQVRLSQKQVIYDLFWGNCCIFCANSLKYEVVISPKL